MAERTYNGFTNRETWLINFHHRESILERVKQGEAITNVLYDIKESLQDQIDKHLENSVVVIVQDMICSKYIVEKINWLELADHYIKELEYQAKTGLGLPINFDGMHLDHEEFMKENCK